MQFTTPVHIAPQAPLSPDANVFLIGSCFSDEIATRMRDWGMSVTANPFGTMYNPLSIAGCITRLQDERPFTEADLVERDGLYHSFMHHGAFSRRTKEEALAAMNEALQAGREAYRQADVLIITFGTAFVYERNGKVVANCHKFPAGEFTRRRLATEEVVNALLPIVRAAHSNGKTVLLTLSPIRHKGDGLAANSLSKATLRVAIDELCSGQVIYFPSYEIFMDELRDYRWYAADMLHPAPQAVDYVWERFQDTFFSPSGRDLLRRHHAEVLASRHRPLHE